MNSAYRMSYIVYRIFLILVSSVLLALSFSTLNLSWLAFVGLVPLFFAIHGQSPKQAFFIFGLCGFLFFLLSMYWLIYVTPTGWILLSLYQAIYFGLFGLFFRCVITNYELRITNYFFIPSAWCLLEYLRSHIGGGIGWNLLGYSQYQNIPLIQIADITGVYGVSFLIVLLNLTVFFGIKMAIKCQKTHQCLFARSTLPFKEEIRINPLFQTLVVFLILVIVLGYGYSRPRTLPAEELKVSVIQGNIPQLQKWDPGHEDYIIRKYEELTLKAAKDRPELIIWPETSAPGYLDENKALLQRIQRLTRMTRTFLLVGANSAILFSKRGELLQQYNKLHLVLFGEYVPFEKYLPFLRRLLPLTGNFIPGSEYTIFSLRTTNYELQTKFATLICFEDIFPGMVRRFVREGADFMVNITNDAWFGRSAAPYQHAANSVFRAVENRRPFVRSANTGLSCFIDSTGRIYGKVSSKGEDLLIEGHRTAIVRIRPDSPLTFYTKFGDIFILFCFLLTVLFLIDYLRRQRYNKNLS